MKEDRVDADHRGEISLEWLVRLRWGAVAGQLVTVIAARTLLVADLPLQRLLGPIGLLAISNLLLASARHRNAPPRALCGAALALDTLLLTALLHATGGAYNPFSVLYLVHITLAAVVLGARWTWFLALLAIGCYGLLFAGHIPLRHLDHAGPEMSLHLQGMWVAFTLAAILTASFVVKLSSAVERRDAAMAELRERAAHHERLAAVTTLAAGAAHELGTPLATIAVAAKELERTLRMLPDAHAGALAADATLIRSELERCRAILDRLGAQSGQLPGEAPVELRLAELQAAIIGVLTPSQQARLRLAPLPQRAVRLPRAALAQVAHSLLQNAFEAGDGAVSLEFECQHQALQLTVRDTGAGIPPAVLARVGEPFFTTRPPGRGLGLGVFIARTLCEQMGGSLGLESRPGAGTTARVLIPQVALATPSADAR